MEHKTSDGRNKRSSCKDVFIELAEEEYEAGNIATEDSNTVDSQPRDKQVRLCVSDTGNAETVAEKKDKEAKYFTEKQKDVSDIVNLARSSSSSDQIRILFSFLLSFFRQPKGNQTGQRIQNTDHIQHN